MNFLDAMAEEANEPPSVIPLIDLLIFTLFFFFLSSEIRRAEYATDVILPRVVDPLLRTRKPIDLTVDVDPRGRYRINNAKDFVGADRLASVLGHYKSSNDNLMVVMNADTSVGWGHVIHLVQICNNLGVPCQPMATPASAPPTLEALR